MGTQLDLRASTGMRNRLPGAGLIALALTFATAACGGASSSPTLTAAPTAAATPAVTARPTSQPSVAFAPVPRSSATMAWDPRSQTVVLFGGDTASGATNALDAWDGTAWTSLSTLGPPPRDDALLVADPDRGVVVLAGGRNGQTVQTDTWEWDGSSWTERTVAGPPPRVHAAAGYDHASKRTIVYGGVNEAGTLRDTWAWDGTSWTMIDEVGIPDRVPNAMAWDPTLKRLLVLAVNLDAPSAAQTYPSELWGFTGTGWELVAGDGPSFSPLQQFVEGPTHPYLVDGGVVTRTFSTYEWSGSEWTKVVGATPPVRNGQAAAFDPVRRALVLFGGFVGNTTFGDTWVLDDRRAWREVAP